MHRLSLVHPPLIVGTNYQTTIIDSQFVVVVVSTKVEMENEFVVVLANRGEVAPGE